MLNNWMSKVGLFVRTWIGLSWTFKPSATDSTVMDSSRSEMIQCSGDGGNSSLNAMSTMRTSASASRTCATVSNCPSTQGMNSNDATFVPSSETGL